MAAPRLDVSSREPSDGWMREPAVEAYLTELGLTWEYVPGVPIGLIKQDASLGNQARVGRPLNPDDVEAYTLAMRQGDRFPAMVAYQAEDGGYVLYGGNHRLEAGLASGRTRVDLYMVWCDDLAIRAAIPANLNRFVGRRPGRADFLQQALFWHDRFGAHPSMTARRWGFTESMIYSALRERTRNDRFRAVGLPIERFPKRVAEVLHKIPNDQALQDAGQLVLDVRLPEAEVRQLVADVAAAPRVEASQVGVVATWAGSEAVKRRREDLQGGVRSALTPAAKRQQQLFGFLRSAARLVERYPTREALGLTTPADLDRVTGFVRTLTGVFDGWVGADGDG